MRAEVSNKILVHDASKAFIQWCRDNLIIANPEYERKKHMGLWTGSVARNIMLYERNANDIMIPFGCFRRMVRDFPTMPVFNAILPVKPVVYDSCINLYDYQEKAVKEALKAKNGIIVMPCGSGKTQTGLELIARLGQKALWLTHTKDLLNQSMARAKEVFGIGEEQYGTITDGKVDIGSAITFATVQTMSRLDLTQYKNTWGCVVVDECHKAVGSPTKVMQFYKVLSNISCRYKFGLTATPERSDGLHISMLALLGDIVFRISQKEIDTTCSVIVQTVETGYSPEVDHIIEGDGILNYTRLVDDITHDTGRFELVRDYINDLYDGGSGATLVLANRVQYLQRLMAGYHGKAVCLSKMGYARQAKEQRRRALIQLNNGELDCVFATYQLAKEGLDIPNLRYVVFATPEKDKTTVTQSAGRVARKYEGKDKGVIVDFVDDFYMLRNWAKVRKGVYKKLGYREL